VARYAVLVCQSARRPSCLREKVSKSTRRGRARKANEKGLHGLSSLSRSHRSPPAGVRLPSVGEPDESESSSSSQLQLRPSPVESTRSFAELHEIGDGGALYSLGDPPLLPSSPSTRPPCSCLLMMRSRGGRTRGARTTGKDRRGKREAVRRYERSAAGEGACVATKKTGRSSPFVRSESLFSSAVGQDDSSFSLSPSYHPRRTGQEQPWSPLPVSFLPFPFATSSPATPPSTTGGTTSPGMATPSSRVPSLVRRLSSTVRGRSGGSRASGGASTATNPRRSLRSSSPSTRGEGCTPRMASTRSSGYVVDFPRRFLLFSSLMNLVFFHRSLNQPGLGYSHRAWYQEGLQYSLGNRRARLIDGWRRHHAPGPACSSLEPACAFLSASSPARLCLTRSPRAAMEAHRPLASP
jgi:hypothetical protein